MRYVRLLALAVAISADGSFAAESEEPAAAVQERLHRLERRLAEIEEFLRRIESLPVSPNNEILQSRRFEERLTGLERQMRVADEKQKLERENQRAVEATAPIITADDERFILHSANGDYRLTLGMTAQTDGRFSLDQLKPITNTFTLRKIRPTFTGRIGKYFDFKVMPDFGNGTTIIQDAYFDIRFRTAFRIRAGKDKTPIGYELLQGDPYLLFPERALASSLVPNRDIGFQVQGDIKGGKVFYAAGVFNGIPDGASTTSELDTNNSKDFAGRIVSQPFKSAAAPRALNGLGFQVGGSYGRQSGALPSFKTSVGQTYFSYASAASADGVRRRISPAVFCYYKQFGAFAEYVRSSQRVAHSGKQTDVTNQGWEVTASMVLTGEAASDRGIRPKRRFDLGERTWGAVQLVGRYAVLSVDPSVFTASLAAATASREARSFTVGANWYPVYFVKIYGAYERTVFRGGALRPSENVILFRSQLAF